ncbi:MAG: hypothetical protein A2787_02560 [Omnitrophica WOR_2 bacterium RIFCSPHIGHO2_01_FULL_48_9]|nr:MAG: hypothetical protein A2787_02560 [Omnitrophica WOR_2 bacterium RIFCSPHIGHO2_01_FULL_48_9]
MDKKLFEPNFRTPRTDLCREENNKLFLHLRQKQMAQEFRANEKTDISWEVEAIAKSNGVYLEFNRAQTGEEKNWCYMIRIAVPGGGPITRKQWNVFDELCGKYTVNPNDNTPSLRFTNRQAIQFHWINKAGVLDIIKRMAECGLFSLNGCGDNVRNVMSCPCSRHSDIFNSNQWAQKVADYFRLPLEPFIEIFAIDPQYLRKPTESFQYGPTLLNRKFKIGFATLHRDPASGLIVPDNCVEMRTNDLGVAPIIENGKVTKFQIYVGGGQGERNGKPTMAALSLPLCQVTEDKLLPVLDAVVKVHMDWGDRQNRQWSRLKYVIKKMGVEWYHDQVSAIVGFPLEKPNAQHDYGARQLHHGWSKQPTNGLLSYGAFIENGRIIDTSPNGKLRSMVRDVMNKYNIELLVTPNQDAIFSNIPVNAQKDFEADLAKYGFGKRNGKAYSTLRLHSGACVGRDSCRLTYTDSEKFEPFLIDELETMGWSDMTESIGITGCERQCFRPGTKTIGLVGSGLNRYQFKLMGDESGRHQGVPLISKDGNEIYLRSVPREKVAVVIDVLFKFYKTTANPNESMGLFHNRIGMEAIIAHLKGNPTTAELMQKPFPTDCVIE